MGYIKLIITLILFAFLYLPIVPPLVREWISVDDYSHGFLIPFISLYFLWHKRDDLKNTPVSPSWAGIVFIVAGLALYFAARIGYQFFLQCLSAFIVLFGIIYVNAGRQMAKKVSFAIAYLVFMIPLPQLVYNTVTFHMRLLSTKLAYAVIKLLGATATRDGNIINLPTCSLVVANPCSGLRGLIVLMAASLAIGYIFQTDIRKRIILFISALLISILMNTARLVATAVAVDMLEAFDVPASVHNATGIIAVMIGLAILFWISEMLRKVR